jgi:hypothetical protein
MALAIKEQNWGEARFKRYLGKSGYSDFEYEPGWPS